MQTKSEMKEEVLEVLVQCAKLGDCESYNELVRRYQRGVKRFIKSILKSPQDADDVLQKTLWSVWNNLSGIQDLKHFESYLFQSARNRALNHIRDENTQPFHMTIEEAEWRGDLELPNQPVQDVEFSELQGVIGEILNELERKYPHYYDAFFFVVEERRSYKKVAEVLGVKVGTIMSRVNRAREYIRERLEIWYLDA